MQSRGENDWFAGFGMHSYFEGSVRYSGVRVAGKGLVGGSSGIVGGRSGLALGHLQSVRVARSFATFLEKPLLIYLHFLIVSSLGVGVASLGVSPNIKGSRGGGVNGRSFNRGG